MITRYMAISGPEKILMVMCPYQVYATEVVARRVFETDKGGFVCHTFLFL